MSLVGIVMLDFSCSMLCFVDRCLSCFPFSFWPLYCLSFFWSLYCLSFFWSLYCLSFCLLVIVLSVILSFGHCIVCPLIYGFSLSHWHLQSFFQKTRTPTKPRIILRIRTRYSNWYMGRHRMVVGFTTNYAISAYHHWCCEFESRSGRDVQHYAIKCQWLATGRWFSSGPTVSSTNKTDRHDITEIWFKVALNTIKQTNKHYFSDLLNNILR